jgi:hypothetical protein
MVFAVLKMLVRSATNLVIPRRRNGGRRWLTGDDTRETLTTEAQRRTEGAEEIKSF